MREITAPDGGTWIVFSVHPAVADGRVRVAAGYGRGWLCFQRGEEKWRHLSVPDDWEAFSEAALLDLLRISINAKRIERPPAHR